MQRDEALLVDMLEHARMIVRHSADLTRERFAEDEVLQAAMTRWIQVIGEAAWQVSDEFKQLHQQVPWAKIAGTRHRLVHDYGNVSVELMWAVIEQHIPELVNQLVSLVPRPPGAGDSA
ncbi:MAG: DUF86 domain-containing protein [Phycisphaera sp.]|nr:DUF86 domain-containing protein [Phycisphaera sp.]